MMLMFPSGAELFSAYASMSATFTLIQQAFHQFVPKAVQQYIYALFAQLFTSKNKTPSCSDHYFKLIIEDGGKGGNHNQIFDACQIYLCNRLSHSSNALKVSRAAHEKTTKFTLVEGVKFSETFEGIHLKWSFHPVASSSSKAPPPHPPSFHDKQSESHFSLKFDKKHKQKVCTSYFSFVIQTSKDIVREETTLELYDCNVYLGRGGKGPVKMNHPFTFDNLAIDHELKKAIIDDLDRFLKRKEFYRRVGKPWKRGYLLYGPPGTGKSSLVAAMANYLRFDVYDLQLGSVNDSSLKSLLLMIPSRSIIVIEDIDCTRALPKRELPPVSDQSDKPEEKKEPQMSLSALLNFFDGLWSCCGDERLIVVTTNHKEQLDPALLRPGRMDMHIHMSYLSMQGFEILAYNYLRVSTDHRLFGEIESLLKCVNASPAEVAEELIRSEDVDVALQGVVELLKRKKYEAAKSQLMAEKEGMNDENAEELSKSESADVLLQVSD